jgi:hypothetical protein
MTTTPAHTDPVDPVGHTAALGVSVHLRHTSGAARMRRFLWHLGEMVLAMWVGMAVFGGLRALLAGTGPVDTLRDHLDFRLVAMALFMAVPMVALMRVRGHRWERTAEMVAAMVVPVVAVCLLAHVVPGFSDAAVSTISHILMYLGMLVVMLARYGEYAHGGPHPADAPA